LRDVRIRDLLIRGERVVGEPEFLVHLGEALRRIEVCGFELENLLVDGDGFEEEALLRVELCDLEVNVDRVLRLAATRVQVADLQQRAYVTRILCDQLLVLGNRLVELALGEELLRSFENFCAIDRHGTFAGGSGHVSPSEHTRTLRPEGECRSLSECGSSLVARRKSVRTRGVATSLSGCSAAPRIESRVAPRRSPRWPECAGAAEPWCGCPQ
jgi:hypothetical protein